MQNHLTEKDLIEFQFGLADEQRLAEIAEHLKVCSECKNLSDRLAGKFSALNLLRTDEKISEELISKTIESAAGRQAGRRKLSFILRYRWQLSAAAVFVLALATVFIFQISNFKFQIPPISSPPPVSEVEAVDTKPPFAPASAIELVVLPRRENVQITIYNSADLTLVREKRNLTLKKGWNWLQFMWANTLIDPTSLNIEPTEQKDKINIEQLVFPPRLRELGRWLIHSDIEGQVPFEITYFTSGLSWRAFYMGTLSEDEKKMNLDGFVRVQNSSGEDYENAQTRLIVGQVHILDQIAELARRQWPYGRPFMEGMVGGMGGGMGGPEEEDKVRQVETGALSIKLFLKDEKAERKEIIKEGLSEYFLYTIEGTETIADKWGKRLPSFEANNIDVNSLYKYDESRWGNNTIRFISFANDERHNLGKTPIPNGNVKVYATADSEGYLSYIGGMDVKYIPIGEEVELNLGPDRLVSIVPTLMSFKTENYKFNNQGNVVGWDEIREWKVEITNTRKIPANIEIIRSFGTNYWSLQYDSSDIIYDKYDATKARFKLTVEPASKNTFTYSVRCQRQQVEDMQAYLVSLWKFNEGVGITAYDSAGKNNGTINGAKWTTSRFGGALSFNGNGDYVNCGNDKSLNINGEITVAAWIYPKSNSWGGIIDKGDNTAGHDDYGLWFNEGKIEFSFNYPERWDVYPNGDRFIGNTTVALNEWSHFAGTWDGKKIRLYVNGRLDSEFDWTQGIKTSNASVYIGVNPGGQEEYFNGMIDEAAIYKKALSAEQIRQLYQNSLKGQ